MRNPGNGADTDSEDSVLGEPYCDFGTIFANSESSDARVGFK